MSKDVKNPWFKFYPTDWKADDALRMRSAAARGLWIEMLCICHNAKPYGYLLVNGEAPTNAQLAVLSAIPPEQVSSLLAELEAAGVFSRTQKGVIYSRRMTRDAKRAAVNRENGKNGGSSKHKKNKSKTKVGNRKPSETPSPRSQRPETREDIPDKSGTDPKEIIFKGKIVRLNQRDWQRLQAEHDLQPDELERIMDERDEYLSRLPEDAPKRVDWWIPTMNDLKTKAEGVRRSRL